ncbi:bifunctional nicotinamidase/pyrazinamidase [Bacillus subtilis]|uniref:bifunctional nicotinamidase/pyrazinamidase n=1 Tax=Pseudochrobactrum asaccharolyticum TaxID=354351 RepID=UPI001F30062F|nr:bifunctional nicotinamidase/pyrazinamidase [Pseudochrobactrum asaccharolyticum]MCF7645885.1 bifunctional nicotinamidase/pyrazinamidase [Pseudochrobactrum asaccharolyticum]MCF7672350.1 bifunctional nicotinamidase/pyrazinamidase [Bacillus subtilis]
MTERDQKTSAFIVIDIQNDFCPEGALGVAGGDTIIAGINQEIERFDHVILTQDWHPADHSSFASQHQDRSPYEMITMPYGKQTLWPDHCVQGTHGAEFHKDLQWTKAELVIRKGYRKTIDSYSAFFENDHMTPTGLGGYLKERGIKNITLAGLATDFCVAYSALDAAAQGLNVTVLPDLSRAIDIDGSLQTMMKQMRNAGVNFR